MQGIAAAREQISTGFCTGIVDAAAVAHFRTGS